MRKIVVLTFMSLDGVMQAPGGPDEDTSNGFQYGGWTAPYFDDEAGKIMTKQMSGHSDLLLGRKTFDIFSSYWPDHASEWPGINDVTKYVVSGTLTQPAWTNSVVLKNTDDIADIKKLDGPDIQVHGSSNLVQSLMKHDLVDEFWLKIFPVTLGSGKRLFGEGTMPQAYTLLHSQITPAGVIVAEYARNGAVKTGSFA